MLLAEFIVYFIRHRAQAVRVFPLFVPAIVVIHIFLPGAIGNFREAFFPKGGLIAEQTQLAANANTELAGGRVRQLQPDDRRGKPTSVIRGRLGYADRRLLREGAKRADSRQPVAEQPAGCRATSASGCGSGSSCGPCDSSCDAETN